MGGISGFLISRLQSVTLGTVNFLFMLFIMLYTMFFFLMDGDKLIDKILYYLPLDDHDERRMLDRFTSVTRATLKGTAVIGIIQGVLAGMAFAVVGIPSAVFWGTIMTVLSIIPGIGSALVWVPAVIILAATNRPDVLDPALLRPGRFDRHVVQELPDRNDRIAILKVHTRKVPLADDVSLENIAAGTPGFSGADLKNLVNEAAILAARRNKKMIEMAELQESIEKIIAGPERRSRVITEEEKQIIAHHEAGHALVMKMQPESWKEKPNLRIRKAIWDRIY